MKNDNSRSFFATTGLLALLLVVSLSQIARAQGTEPTNCIDAGGLRQGHWKITAQMLHSSSFPLPYSIVIEGNYVDSKREGIWVEYNVDRTTKATWTYKNDVIDGLYKTYYADGTLWTEFTWTEGQLQGPAKTYYPNGNLYEEGTWQDDFWVGEYKIYTESGALKRTENKPFGIHFSDSTSRN